MLAKSGWLPEPLRTAGVYPDPEDLPEISHAAGEETTVLEDKSAMAEPEPVDDNGDLPADVLAEAAE